MSHLNRYCFNNLTIHDWRELGHLFSFPLSTPAGLSFLCPVLSPKLCQVPRSPCPSVVLLLREADLKQYLSQRRSVWPTSFLIQAGRHLHCLVVTDNIE